MTHLLLTLAASASALAPMPKDAAKPVIEVHAVGVYEGTLAPGVARKGHTQGNVTVTVPAGKGPMVLVLTAYEPVRWTINAPKGAVARVIASGYHAQQVDGLPKEVPITLSSHQAGDAEYVYAYQQDAGPNADADEQAEVKQQYEKLVELVKKQTQMEIKSFQGSYRGSSFSCGGER